MESRTIVVGAGPIGLCLAIALAERGIEVDVIERQPPEALAAPEFDGREVALTHASIQLLWDLGVWDHVDPRETAPVIKARVMDDADEGFTIDAARLGHERLGVLAANHAIRAAAWRVASAHERIHIHSGVAVEKVRRHPAGVDVHLADGRALHAPLLVACDSRFSQLRREQGIATYMHDFGATMLVFRVGHAVANERTAWEWFGHGQTRALLPLGEHRSSVVLTVPPDEAQALMELPPEELAAEVATRYEGRLGEVTLESPVRAYPLVATWAHRFIAPRFALAGDAAIGMHPVTAHGFNLGLAGVRHLAEAVAEGVRRHRDPGHATTLARYQRRLRRSAALIFVGTQTVARLFTDERRLAQPLRRAIMLAGRRIPPLRQALGVHVTSEHHEGAALRHRLRSARRVLLPPLPAVAPWRSRGPAWARSTGARGNRP